MIYELAIHYQTLLILLLGSRGMPMDQLHQVQLLTNDMITHVCVLLIFILGAVL